MKRLFLLSAMVLSCAFCLAQNKTSYAGIYYYDSSSYGVMDRDSADYYRVVENNNTFNDYYAKDNALRASGALSYADPSDDSKTVFEGAFIAYYPNGKVWINASSGNTRTESWSTITTPRAVEAIPLTMIPLPRSLSGGT